MKHGAMSMDRAGWRRSGFWLAAGIVAAGLSHGNAGAEGMRLSDLVGLQMVHGGLMNSAAGGHSSPGYLGVDIRDVTDVSSPAAKARSSRGAEIVRVDHDGPAGKAGLREHDVVLLMDGQAIDNGEQLRRLLHDAPPGRSLTLTIIRDGQQQTVSAQMSTREDVEREAWDQHVAVTDPAPNAAESGSFERRGSGFFSSPGRVSRNFLGGIGFSPGYTGVLLESMAPQLAEYFGAQGKTGLLVRSVDSNSPAAVAGLHAGDVVLRVNATNIGTSSDWVKTIRENKGRPVNVVVLRERREQTLTMIPNAKHHSSLIPDRWVHPWSSHATLERASAVEPDGVAPGPLSRM